MRDFGGMILRRPHSVVSPTSAMEVAAVIRDAAIRGTEVVARGCGHSTRGDSLTNGVVLDMRGMATVHRVGSDRITIGAGATWREVLDVTLPNGLMPPVLTDFLDLTVGGTLSAAGIGGASHIYGTQAANVHQLEVVTPRAEIITCSPTHHRHLFDAVRAGMGRRGVITAATLRLVAAPQQVLSCRLRCYAVAELIAEQRRVVADHISGQVKSAGLELRAVVYNTNRPPRGRSFTDFEELSFADFADRMRPDVAKLMEIGEWEHPHPWGQVIIPASEAATFIEQTLSDTTAADIGLSGVILIERFRPGRVPQLRAPSDAVLFALLRTASPGSRTAVEMSAANDRLYARAKAIGGVPYPPQPISKHTRAN
jgi:hypothetical protein